MTLVIGAVASLGARAAIACSQCGARFEVAATRFELYMS